MSDPVIAQKSPYPVDVVEGKKYFAGTALFNADGECCAFSKQVWIGRRD